MAKIVLDNHYHAEGNMRIAATCPADMCGISGIWCAEQYILDILDNL